LHAIYNIATVVHHICINVNNTIYYIYHIYSYYYLNQYIVLV